MFRPRSRSPRRPPPGAAWLLILATLAACASQAPPSGEPGERESAAAFPIPTGLPTPAAELRPPTADSAWGRAVSSLGEDGLPSKDAALELFALAIADVPGVSVTPDDLPIRSGSLAIRAVYGRWDELSREQRAAVEAALSLPEDTVVIEIGPVDGGSEEARVLAAGFAPPMLRDASAFEAPEDHPYTQEVVAALESAARSVRATIATRMGEDIPGTVDVALAPSSSCAAEPRSVYGCAIALWGSSSGTSPTGGGAYAGCRVVVTGLALSAGASMVINTLAHEVFHCFQARGYGSLARASAAPRWVIEGGAEWVGNDVVGILAETDLLWDPWFLSPGISLMARSYDAVGFWAHLAETGTDPYDVFPAVFYTRDGPAAYRASGAAQNERFLDSWASSLTRKQDWGRDWDSEGNGIPGTRADPELWEVADGSSVEIHADAYTARLMLLDVSADIVAIVGTGHARISDGRVDTLAFPAKFCTKGDGCPPCPNSDRPPPAPLGSRPWLVLTGGDRGATYTVEGRTLEEECEEEDEFCGRYRELLHWWFLDPATDVGSKPWAAEIVRRFEEMRPLAPPAQQAAVDIHIGLYTAHATLSGPEEVRAAVPWAEQMPQAVASLDAHCDIRPADRGGQG